MALDDIELIQRRALSLTSMISAELEEEQKYSEIIESEQETEDRGLKIYECSASDDENAMNYDFKCHAIWKHIDNDFDTIKQITNDLPPTSHNKIQFNIFKKSEKRDIEFGNFYGENNDIIKFDFFDALKRCIICPQFIEGMEWFASDIEVSNVNEAIVQCYNMLFGLLRYDQVREDAQDEIVYNLKFLVWKGRYKTVDELASLETFVVDE